MTNPTITESGMEFYGEIFHIEVSDTYKTIMSHGVKIAEFILFRSTEQPIIWIIEAKSSSPNPENPQNQEKFDKFIRDISEKLANALSLYIAISLKRHPTHHELPSYFQGLNLEKLEFRLLLVIKGHQDKWLPPLQETLAKALQSTVKIWNLSANSVLVLNDELARQKGFIR